MFHVRTETSDIRLAPMTARDFLTDRSILADDSVDLVLTDPPYVISRCSGFRRRDAQGNFGGNPQYAIHTDFGDWDKAEGFTMEDLAESIDALHRVLRPGGVAIVFFDIWKISDLVRIMDGAGLVNPTMIEWVKTNAVPINSRKNYLTNAREVVVVAHKPVAASNHEIKCKSISPNGAYKYPIHAGKDRFHPTQKSLALFEELIETHTDPGDLVVDCFSGSGTTAAAAARTGRSFAGCEPDQDPKTNYYGRSIERIETMMS
mgnify:FL=1